MKYSTTPTRILTCCLALVATACPPPQPGPNPPAAGGSASGGASATGGAPAPVVVFPACKSSEEQALTRALMLHPRKFGRPTKPRSMLERDLSPATLVGKSVMWTANTEQAADQDGIGECTGEDVTQVSATQPYQRQATEADAQACYSAATKLDNGCAWNAASCKGAWFPSSPAVNDNGSWASSALRAAVFMGWFRGERPVTQTLQGWVDALQLGPCAFDQNWYQDGFSPDRCGYVTLTGGLAGGHSTAFVGWDSVNQEAVLRNSWSNDFGVCIGKACGYFRYTVSSLRALWSAGAEMVCPATP